MVAKSSSTLNVYTSTAQLPASWDNSLPANHPLQSEALALYETIKLPDITCFYASFVDGEKPSAIAYFQLLKVLPKHLNAGLLGGYQANLAPLCLQVFRPSLLIAGHLFRHDIVTFYAPTLSPIESYRAYEAMIQAVVKKSCAMATLIKDVPNEMVTYFQNFAPHYTQLRNDISMEMLLPNEWIDFVDYEKALKHKYAQKLRKVRASIKDLAIKELTTAEVFAQAESIYQLYQQVSSRQAISLGLLNAAFLPELKKANEQELKVWAFYEGEKMVAFASAWAHPTCFDMFYIGFDYERNASLSLYFNILYFSIEQAIVHQKAKLNLGRTALEAKARLGCTPRYLPTFLYVKNVCIRALVNSKINLQHEQEGAWEERHPLKS
jgi:hypothetical protein